MNESFLAGATPLNPNNTQTEDYTIKNKAITCFFSTLPYSGTAEKQAKLKKSAGHSIRDENAKSETIEWNPDLSHLNQVYINNQWTKLDNLNNDDKSASKAQRRADQM
ncbi:hypothetical protein AB4582_23775 [Vibrio splendidus]